MPPGPGLRVRVGHDIPQTSFGFADQECVVSYSDTASGLDPLQNQAMPVVHLAFEIKHVLTEQRALIR
jgi:hypothetical protein